MTARSAWGGASLAALALLAGCSGKGGDPASQYGPDPRLPEAHQYLLPPMSVPKVVGWQSGQAPTVPAGLRIQALATGLMHPRIVYALPNGQVFQGKPAIREFQQMVFGSAAPFPTPTGRIAGSDAMAVEIEAKLPDGSVRNTTNIYRFDEAGLIRSLTVYMRGG